MKNQNKTRLSGASLNVTARAIARRHKNPHHWIYYSTGGSLRRIAAQSLEWQIGKLGELGFCGDAPEKAQRNPGYIYISN